MKFKIITFACLMAMSMLLPSCREANSALPEPAGEAKVTTKNLSGHPRILLFKEDEKTFKSFVNSEQCWRDLHKEIVATSDKMLTQNVVQRTLVGRRLLDVSREALKRIFFLSYSYRTTGDEVYAQRAEKELLAVSNFSDWNPSHFLDVGEMALGVAIGYDWLYDYLSVNSKNRIKKALMEKAIEPSSDSRYNDWLDFTSNWSQVCNTGILYASLAIAEDFPELTQQIIDRSISSIYMGTYAPDGIYPEGAGYWSYGTSFNAMFISALEKAFKDSYGLLDKAGLKETPKYAQHMIDPAGIVFNYSDANAGSRAGLNTSMFWFASQFNDPSLLWMQRERLYSGTPSQSGNRIAPAILIWSAGLKSKNINTPKERIFYGQGENPVASMRTSWTDPNAIYLGFKAGRANTSHAHMDVGSFILVADGVRWAEDLGMQEYESLESLGMNIWSYAQDSDRWKVFRMNNKSHNTLTVDDRLQNAAGYAKIDAAGENKHMMYAISDISESYTGQLQSVKRGAAIIDDSYAVIRDQITMASGVKTRWNMATKATVSEISGNKAILSKDGKKLVFRIDYPAGAVIKTWPGTPPGSWDAANPGVTFIGFEYHSATEGNVVLQVSLIPDQKNESKYTFDNELESW